jgi:hypothetical protein
MIDDYQTTPVNAISEINKICDQNFTHKKIPPASSQQDLVSLKAN